MKQEYLKIAGVVVLLLPSCTYRQPVISSIQHDTVAIQSEVRLLPSAEQQEWRKKAIEGEARRACTLYGREVSQLISSRCAEREHSFNACITEEFLFACTPEQP